MEFRVDREFKSLIPPLSEDEYAALEANILKDGVRDALVVWNGLLLDGHNRLAIARKHDVKFRAIEAKGIESRDDAKVYILRNQLGRRNITPYVRAELALKLEPLIAAKAKANQVRTAENRVRQNSDKQEVDTKKEIARVAKVSHDTIARVKVITAKADEATKEKLRAGKATVNAVYSQIRRAEKRVATVAEAKMPTDKFHVILADPPWQYEFSETQSRKIENEYDTMTVKAICKLPVPDISHKDCVLFLWATSPKLREALEVMDAWGFEYRTCMVWVKDKIGMGYYARQRHELLLIGTKGKLPVPEPSDRPDSVIEAPRGKHSAKPVEQYPIIERMYPDMSRVELFCRKARDGWMAWGNQL